MIIECRNVTKEYAADNMTIRAVRDASLRVDAGDFVVILGHSGSGKTTFLSLIGGLTRPDSGRILINGVESWKQNDRDLSAMRNSTIGFIFQFASLIPTLTALENVLLPLSFSRNPAADRSRAMELLDMVGLADKHNALPAHLSGGQQRRVAIARSFVNSPSIILADEPTGDLDEETERDILKIFKEFNDRGVTFLIVTHNKDLPRIQPAARVLTMRNGVVAEG